MSLALQLILALVATVGALGGVIWSGVTHRRSVHYRFVTLFIGCLGLAIWRAEVYGRGLVFEGTAALVHKIHMGAVLATLLALPFVAWTGIRLARGRSGSEGADPRRGHRRASEIFVGLVLLTSALGTAMTLLATRP